GGGASGGLGDGKKGRGGGGVFAPNGINPFKNQSNTVNNQVAVPDVVNKLTPNSGATICVPSAGSSCN
ncbi:hypothetical protein, partial [Helicobacter heilmannii]|uniref:hypothetical protein n=1 Tax=Helicobacter heilmannii TaxID=35817 RepID=UPI0013151321